MGSVGRAAEHIGVDRETVVRAREHVAAVERYPELTRIGAVSQKDALTIARNLDALPEPEREEAR